MDYGTTYLVLAIVFGLFMAWGIGANDVANAVGPLAAIVSTLGDPSGVAAKVTIPFWVMVVGAFGIAPHVSGCLSR